MTKQTFKQFYKNLTPEEKKDLAKEADTSVNHLSQLAYGHRGVGMDLLERLLNADERITFKMLRPKSKLKTVNA